ncbi:MAG: glycosyltransferase [Thermoflexibacter sp.]|jgi:glycosyltransferase involved in cell wall biosynthesis|nr:glycosyltransferase [Thermoflexibacter sp.]
MSLVSIIALCYNHADYVEQSLASVCGQSYPFIELIVVDDASTDKSTEVIKDFIAKQKDKNIQFVALMHNQGNCKAFNIGLAKAKGKYVIDLSTDDILLPDCVENQVKNLEGLEESYAAVFSDVYLIDKESMLIKTFYQRENGFLVQSVPSGDVYKHILARSFISAPSMMWRKSILEEIGGYDESLSYEDYDLWVRTSQKYKYYFIDKCLVKKRILKDSHGSSFYKRKNNKHLSSTLKVHYKALAQNQSEEENQALAVSVRYHLRLSFFTENHQIVAQFGELLKQMNLLRFSDKLLMFLAKLRLPISPIYYLYLRYLLPFYNRKINSSIFNVLVFCTIHLVTIIFHLCSP